VGNDKFALLFWLEQSMWVVYEITARSPALRPDGTSPRRRYFGAACVRPGDAGQSAAKRRARQHAAQLHGLTALWLMGMVIEECEVIAEYSRPTEREEREAALAAEMYWTVKRRTEGDEGEEETRGACYSSPMPTEQELHATQTRLDKYEKKKNVPEQSNTVRTKPS